MRAAADVGNAVSAEPLKLTKSISRVQLGERFVQRFTSVMVELLVVVLVCVGVMVAFTGLLMSHRKKLKRLPDADRLVKGRRASHLGKSDITTFPGSSRRSDDRESSQSLAEGSGYPAGLDSPSWLSNRLCG